MKTPEVFQRGRFTHCFSIVSSGSPADLFGQGQYLADPVHFFGAGNPSNAHAGTQAEALDPAKPKSFDTSALDRLISPASRAVVKHPDGVKVANDASMSHPDLHTSPHHATPTTAQRTAGTPRMKLSQLLRAAAQQSAPGHPGENPFAHLLLNAAKALDSHPDSVLLDFLEDHCSVSFSCGASKVVNPLDLRRSVTLMRADHLVNLDGHHASQAAAVAADPADNANPIAQPVSANPRGDRLVA